MLAGRLRETNDKLQKASEQERTGSNQVRDLLKKKLEGGQSMEGVSFKGANLAEVFMNNANFSHTCLVGAKLSGVKAKQTNFHEAKSYIWEKISQISILIKSSCEPNGVFKMNAHHIAF